MKQRRTSSAQFKSQVVFELLSVAHTLDELCRQYQPNAQLLSRWKKEFV